MNITQINLSNFRNFKKITLKDFKRINVIIGDNGTGKTSIIESIYMCSVGKSFRTNSDNNIIKKGCLNYKIKLYLSDENKRKTLEILYNEKGKVNKINTSIKKRMSEFIGKYKVLLFSPDEMKIIKDSPRTRRNYFNIQISQVERLYISYLNEYNKVLKNRNEYLRGKNINKQYLEILDDSLIKYGTKIYKHRKSYIDMLNKKIEGFSKKIGISFSIRINYISNFENYREVKDKIIQSFERDLMYGMSHVGVHRDEFEFMYNDSLAKDYASQGQQKMILLIMKLAEMAIFKGEYKQNPILLLDDLFSELDENNQNKLIEFLGKKSQIFITTTDINNIKNKKNINVINLNKMEVENEG